MPLLPQLPWRTTARRLPLIRAWFCLAQHIYIDWFSSGEYKYNEKISSADARYSGSRILRWSFQGHSGKLPFGPPCSERPYLWTTTSQGLNRCLPDTNYKIIQHDNRVETRVNERMVKRLYLARSDTTRLEWLAFQWKEAFKWRWLSCCCGSLEPYLPLYCYIDRLTLSSSLVPRYVWNCVPRAAKWPFRRTFGLDAFGEIETRLLGTDWRFRSNSIHW